MPRRIPDYALQFAEWNMVSSIGAFIFGFTQLIFVYNVFTTIRSGRRAEMKQWEGADSLEWTHLPTPMPYHTFEVAPIVK
jgi:cytochrome c oxidase subunit 1